MQNPPGLSGEDFCKSPDGGSDYNSHIADFTTDFHKQYRDAIVDFLGKTKMDMLETDVRAATILLISVALFQDCSAGSARPLRAGTVRGRHLRADEQQRLQPCLLYTSPSPRDS